MAAQRKYPPELRERATRMALEARRDPARARGAIKRIAEQLGVHPEALRTWVRQAEIDEGARTGTTSEDAQRIAELERENRELRRANEILRTASAFFAAAEVDRRLRSSSSTSTRTAKNSGSTRSVACCPSRPACRSPRPRNGRVGSFPTRRPAGFTTRPPIPAQSDRRAAGRWSVQ